MRAWRVEHVEQMSWAGPDMRHVGDDWRGQCTDDCRLPRRSSRLCVETLRRQHQEIFDREWIELKA